MILRTKRRKCCTTSERRRWPKITVSFSSQFWEHSRTITSQRRLPSKWSKPISKCYLKAYVARLVGFAQKLCKRGSLGWRFTHSLISFYSCSVLQSLMPSLEREQNFSTELRAECLIAILRAFSIHGEHSECISPLTRIGFTIFRTQKNIFIKILHQIPRVDSDSINLMLRVSAWESSLIANISDFRRKKWSTKWSSYRQDYIRF